MTETLVAAVAAISSIIDLCVNNDRCEQATAIGATLGALGVAILLVILESFFGLIDQLRKWGRWW